MYEEEQERRGAGRDSPITQSPSHSHQLSLPSIPVPKPPQVLLPPTTPKPASTATTKPTLSTQWNTTNLGLRIFADATSAASASILVAPLITIIDRSIVTKAATSQPLPSLLFQSAKPFLLTPHKFLVSKPFLLIFSLYFSTYFTANTIDTLSSTLTCRPAETTTSSTAKFVGTSAVNMSLCVYKDSQFARLFGSTSTSTIPKISLTLFALRDSTTIFASFNLPSLLAPRLSPSTIPKPLRQRFSKLLSTESGRLNTAQFLTPAAMQVFSTPIHLLGLDLYNRQGRMGWEGRWARVRRDWIGAGLARMGRIVPAFGVGGVVNGGVRRRIMSDLN
jgi:hypothetical protein